MTASNILVVDTDPSTAELVGTLFPSDVCIVQQAADAAEALETARTTLPVLVMICADIDSGYGCCRQFKKDAALESLPVVLVSAHATPEQFRDHQKLPTSADAYLHKPLDESLLASVVIDLLGTARRKQAHTTDMSEPIQPDDVEEVPREIPGESHDEHDEKQQSEAIADAIESTGDSPPTEPLGDGEHLIAQSVNAQGPASTDPDFTPNSESPYTMPTAALVQVDALTHERDALLSQNEDLKQANQRSQQFFEIEQQRLLSQIATLKARYEALEEKLRRHSVEELANKIEAQQDQIVSLRAEIHQLKSVRRNLEHTLTDALATVAKLPQDN